MNTKRVLYVFFVILVASISGLMGALAGGLGVYSALHQTKILEPTPLPTIIVSSCTPTNPQQSFSDIQTPIIQAVEKAGPVVVTVVSEIKQTSGFFGTTSNATASGSGVIISKNGYVLTNFHVVENASKVTIIMADGKEYPVEIIGVGQFIDLAVLKAAETLPAVAELGNSDNLKPGETVVAIGSPLGDFKNSVTMGVVSATGRNLDTGKGYQMEGLIQTDAAINQGNSGGPLVNLLGQVIGINTLVVRSSGTQDIAEGLGFAIPANTAHIIAEQIIEQGYVSRPYMGIRWQWVNPYLASAYGLPVEWGVYISYVEPGSPADKAKLLRGDIIIQIGDVALDDAHPYLNTLFNFKPGDTLTLIIQRGGKRINLDITLGSSNFR